MVTLALVASIAVASGGVQAATSAAPAVVSVNTAPFSAVVRWKVDDAARVVVEVGVDDRYGIWSPTSTTRGAATEKTTLAGLEPATTYRYRVLARFRNGQRGEDRGTFRTDPWPHQLSASVAPSLENTSSGSLTPFILNPALPPKVAGGSNPVPPGSAPAPPAGSSAPLRVNGVPVFPRMVWRQCPTYFPTSIAAGINVFLGVSCGNTEDQFANLAGRAASTTEAHNPGESGPSHSAGTCRTRQTSRSAAPTSSRRRKRTAGSRSSPSRTSSR